MAGTIITPLQKFQHMTDVPKGSCSNFPAGLRNLPFMYVEVDTDANLMALATLSIHDDGQFYDQPSIVQKGTGLEVTYNGNDNGKGTGCMAHVIPNQTKIAEAVQVTVKATKQVVRTAHADDASHPWAPLQYDVPTPLCFVEWNGDKATVHCMLYLEGTGQVLGTNGQFVKYTDDAGNLIDWRLEIPMKKGTSPVLQYVQFTVDKAIGIKSGDVLRLKVATDPTAGGTGRSFAFVWP